MCFCYFLSFFIISQCATYLLSWVLAKALSREATFPHSTYCKVKTPRRRLTVFVLSLTRRLQHIQWYYTKPPPRSTVCRFTSPQNTQWKTMTLITTCLQIPVLHQVDTGTLQCTWYRENNWFRFSEEPENFNFKSLTQLSTMTVLNQTNIKFYKRGGGVTLKQPLEYNSLTASYH